MNKVANILDAARALSPDERRRLVSELDALDTPEAPDTHEPLGALRALSGTVHSEFEDIAADKYGHVAAAAERKD